jgi:hypothetical protein
MAKDDKLMQKILVALEVILILIASAYIFGSGDILAVEMFRPRNSAGSKCRLFLLMAKDSRRSHSCVLLLSLIIANVFLSS